MKVDWDWDHVTNRFQKFAFSVNSTRPHDTDTVAFSSLSILEIVFKSLRFHRKRYIVFVWTGHENATKYLRFQMKTPCGRGRSNLSLNHSAVHRPTRKKGKSKSLIVIESENIEDDRVSWRFRRSFLRSRGSRLTLFSTMTDISRHVRVPEQHKAVQVDRKYSKASLVSSGSHWVSEHACVFLGLSCLLSSASTELIS